MLYTYMYQYWLVSVLKIGRENTLNSPIEAQCAKAKGWRLLLLFILCMQMTEGNFSMFSLLF